MKGQFLKLNKNVIHEQTETPCRKHWWPNQIKHLWRTIETELQKVWVKKIPTPNNCLHTEVFVRRSLIGWKVSIMETHLKVTRLWARTDASLQGCIHSLWATTAVHWKKLTQMSSSITNSFSTSEPSSVAWQWGRKTALHAQEEVPACRYCK